MSSEKTIVGVPFYEKEGQECLDVTLQNIDSCLGKLAIDTMVIVQVNGPMTAESHRTDLVADSSHLNSEVEIIASSRVGQAYAMDDMLAIANKRDVGRIFMTDADIYRFPYSMKNMWNNDGSVVGARYRPYPLELVEAHFGELNYEEKLLYRMFDGDQIPEVREAMRRTGVDKKDWVKASLMLLDVQLVAGMHDGQNQATDSVMNRKLDTKSMVIAEDALFMHMGRIDMTDHIKARLRHFRAAESRGELDNFLHKEVQLPSEVVINQVAKDIRNSNPNGDFLAMLYLTRCAVRAKVNEICMKISKGIWQQSDLKEIYPLSMLDVKTYMDAEQAVSRFFLDIDWLDLEGFSVGPPPVTQERLRQPFNIDEHVRSNDSVRIALRNSFRLPDKKRFIIPENVTESIS